MAGALGFLKPQATQVRPGDMPTFKDLPMQEKLLMLGAVMRGDNQMAMQIPMLAAARKRQADEQAWRSGVNLEGVPIRRQAQVTNDAGEDISAGFAPQIETVKGPRPTTRDLIPWLQKGIENRYDVEPYLKLLERTDPDVDYVNGVRVDKRDSRAPSFVPTFDKGQEPLYDANGRIVAVRNMDGSVKAASEMAGAVTGAQEREKARYDIGKYDLPDGSTAQIPRLTAVEGLGGASGVPLKGGASPAPAGLGRSQTPADKVRTEGRAKTEVEIEALTPKARATIDTLDRKTDFVLEALRKAKNQVSGGLGGSSGLNALTAGIPETAAYDLRSTLDTIEAAVGFDELQQMRDNSPTGGAVGNLTERELSLLASLRGSLKQGQSSDQLRSNIERMIGEIEKVRNERRAAFQRQFGSSRAPGGGGGRITPEQARAELARRRAEREQ